MNAYTKFEVDITSCYQVILHFTVTTLRYSQIYRQTDTWTSDDIIIFYRKKQYAVYPMLYNPSL